MNKKQILIIIIAVMTGLFFILKNKSFPITGDGHEYVLMSQSLVNHGTPDLRAEDVKDVINKFQFRSPEYNDQVFNCLSDYPCLTKKHGYSGYFESKDNDYYSWHFFGYSLINAPAYYLYSFTKAEPTVSFVYTNIAFFCLAIFLICMQLNSNWKQKIVILSGIITYASLNYLKWNHPESITFSLVIISLVYLKNKSYKISSLFLAICSMQNPPLAIAALVVYIYGLINLSLIFQGNSLKFLIQRIYKDIPFGILCSIIILLPSAFYYHKYGVLNLIVSKGLSDSGLISFDRIVSFYFDFNQGMILLIPLFLLFLPLIFFTVFNSQKNKNTISIFLLLLFLSLITAIPSTSTTNWNPGGYGVLRYTYWNSAFIIFALAELITVFVSKLIVNTIILSLFASQLLIAYLQKKELWYAINNISMAPVAEFILKHYPGIYYPNPEIILERSLNREGDTPNFFKNGNTLVIIKDGNIITQIGDNPVKNTICRPILSKIIENVKYWKFDDGCKILDEKINTVVKYPFAQLTNDKIVDYKYESFNTNLGWSRPESGFRWSDGKISYVTFNLSKTEEINEVVFKGRNYNSNLKAELSLNGNLIFSGAFASPENRIISIPAKASLFNVGANTIKIVWNSPESPSERDERKIAFALESIELK